ncbi:MAG: rhomboid family intramembrane serine protease [Pseudomonadota bacterium]
MFPIRDENPTVHTPVVTYMLIGMNLVVWGAVQGFGNSDALAQSYCLYALIPGDLFNAVAQGTQFPVGDRWACAVTADSRTSTLFSSMFMHGGWFHLLGNMLFLWIFGDNVEDVMGPIRFFIFYVLCGLAAAMAQIATEPSSLIPMVGASGAIGGVMGAYALLFPRARIQLLIFVIVIITTISVPAIFMLAYWFILQLVSGLASFNSTGGGVAFWAHIGGFVAGIVLAFVFRDQERMALREELIREVGRRPLPKFGTRRRD